MAALNPNEGGNQNSRKTSTHQRNKKDGWKVIPGIKFLFGSSSLPNHGGERSCFFVGLAYHG
jgi:hypothetical protein